MNKLFIKLLVSVGVLVPAYVYAASPFLKPIKDLLGDLEIFIQFLNWALPALGILVFFLLIIGFIGSKMGFTFFGMLKVKSGKSIWWGLVGLACMFAVYGLIQLIGALVGVDTNRAKTITAPSLPQVGGVRGGGYYNQ
jgi:hypothetical protein